MNAKRGSSNFLGMDAKLQCLTNKTNLNALKLGILPRINNDSFFAQFFRGNIRLICQVKSIALNPWLYNGMAYISKRERNQNLDVLANTSIARNDSFLLKF